LSSAFAFPWESFNDGRGSFGKTMVIFSPVRFNDDAVDLFDVHDAGLVADRFNERAQAQIAGAAQQPFVGRRGCLPFD
jgi:hypothetical protein